MYDKKEIRVISKPEDEFQDAIDFMSYDLAKKQKKYKRR